MATPQTSTKPTKAETTKSAKTTTNKSGEVGKVLAMPNTLSTHTNRKNAVIDAKNVETVTSLKLRRQLISGEVAHVPGFYLSEDDHTTLSIMMVKHKVTLDELIRGCITSVLTTSDPDALLRNYIPLMS